MKELLRVDKLGVARRKTSELHKRVVSTMVGILVVVLPAIFLLPFVKSLVFGEDYSENLRNWCESAVRQIVNEETDYLTVAFGVIAIGVALFALSSNRSSISTNGELCEADNLAQYVSILNSLFSIYFTIVFGCSLTVTLISGEFAPSFNILLTSFLGLTICGVVSGFHGQSSGRRIDARRYNENYKRRLLTLLDEYNENELKDTPNVYHTTTGQAVVLVAAVSFLEILAGVPPVGVLLAALVSLIYGTLTSSLYLHLRLSKWNTVNPEKVTNGLLTLMWLLMWPLTVVLSGVMASSVSSASDGLARVESGFIVGALQLLSLLIIQTYLSKARSVEIGVKSGQLRIIRSRVENIDIWLGNFRDWIRPVNRAAGDILDRIQSHEYK